MHAGIAGTCVENGEPVAVDYMSTTVSTSIRDCAAGRWCGANGGPVHEYRCTRPVHDVVHGSRMPVACYEYSDMINSFQTLVPACGGWIIPRVYVGGQLHTALGL